MMPFEAIAAAVAAPPAAAAAWILYRSHKTKARTAVAAVCLACTYTETKQGRTAATAAGNAHGDATGHPLILVKP